MTQAHREFQHQPGQKTQGFSQMANLRILNSISPYRKKGDDSDAQGVAHVKPLMVRSILWSIQNLTGSQWTKANTEVM